MNVLAKKVTGNNTWGTSYTWYNQPTLSDVVMDYRTLSSSSEGQYIGWNITELVKEHYLTENTASDISSFALEAYDGTTMTDDDYANVLLCMNLEGAYPILQIVYRDTKGIEGYYTCQTHNLGNAGIAYIGDYNTQLTYIKPLVSYESTIMSYGLSLVYNSSFGDKNFTNNGKNLHTKNFTTARTGPGWKLSAQETVVEITIEDSSEAGTASWLVYNDSDGTEHYFKQKSGSTTEYEDEDGLNLTITKNGTDFTMKDEKDNRKFFKGGYLQQISDANGNKIHIVYNYGTVDSNRIDGAGSNRITSIWAEPREGTEEKIFQLSYDSYGYVSVIQQTYGENCRIGYGMGSDGYSYPEVIYYYQEDAAAYVPAVTCEYTSEDLLSVIMDVEAERGICYTYQKSPTGYRVNYWEERAGSTGASTGNRVTVTTDEIRKTIYRDHGTDRIKGNSDDIETSYIFNSSGHTVNVYSRDAAGKFLGVTAAAYEEKNGTSKKNNHMANSIAGGQAGVNLLLNGSFEKYSTDETSASGWLKSGSGSAARRATAPRSGTAHYNIYNSSTSGSQMIYRTVSLEKGKTYTASAYVNTEKASAIASGGGVFLKVLYNNVQLEQGVVLAYCTDQELDNGWQRISVTFTPTATGTHSICIQWKNAAGTVRVDDVQLEMESAPSSYNHVYNGSFENGEDGWTLSSNNQEHVSTEGYFHGSKSFRANGYPGTVLYAQQTISLKKSSDTTFLLSGWSRGDSVPEIENTGSDTTKRFWGIRLTLNYSDGTAETHDLPFNEFIHQWQYASMAVAPKKTGLTINTAILRLCYYNNANTAFFDNISLTEEPCQTYKYNDQGNLVSVRSTGNGTENYSYDSTTQNLLSVGTEGSGTYTYKYENSVNKHLPTSVINDTVTMGIIYDNYGQSTKTILTSSKDSSVKMESSAAYGNGLLTSQTDSTGAVTTYSYDGNRKLLSTGYENGQSVKTYYDSVWNRMNITYQSGYISADFGYEKGNLESIVRSGYLSHGQNEKYSQTYGFTYDVFGNRTAVTLSGEVRDKADSNALLNSGSAGTLATYSYNTGNGTLKSMTYGSETSPLAVVTYSYDKLDRPVTVAYTNTSPQKTTTYGYNYSSDGALAGVTVNGTLKYIYDYDSLGRLIYSAKLQDKSPVLYTSHRYDTSDRLEKQSWQIGNDSFSEEYTYQTADGTLAQMNINGEELDFCYNSLKQLSKRTSPKLDIEYTYCTQNNLASSQVYEIRYRKHGETTYRLPKLTYTYDAMGNITSVTPLDKTALTYTYDKQNQLLTETRGAVKGTYVYDTFGNIRSKQWTDAGGTESYTFTYTNAGWQDQLTQVSYTNTAGTTTAKTLVYDAIGNPISYFNGEKTWTFQWQNGRQLSSAASGSTSIQYTYDVDGIRDSKTVGSVKHNYTTLSGKIIRETYGETTVDYLYDNSGRPYKIVVDQDGTEISGYYALNLQGDVIAIIDTDGEVAVTYEYDAWGRQVGCTTSGDYGSGLYNCNALKYRGYYYDVDLGLYYLNSRFYDAELGRFISADAVDLVLASQSTLTDKNLYAYCDNNPITRIDASGRAWETVFDVISLGASIADVAANPANVWAWAGLAGDIADIAIPFVGGIGETIKCCGAVNKADNVIDAAKQLKKSVSTSVGTYEITYKSGKNYVGKGSFARAIQSAKRYADPHRLNGGRGDEVLSITWKRANDDREAFMTEYLWQSRKNGTLSADDYAETYNQRWSPGKRYLGWVK